MVPDAIKALKDKKAWFAEQPRPTATTAKPAQVRKNIYMTRNKWDGNIYIEAAFSVAVYRECYVSYLPFCRSFFLDSVNMYSLSLDSIDVEVYTLLHTLFLCLFSRVLRICWSWSCPSLSLSILMLMVALLWCDSV